MRTPQTNARLRREAETIEAMISLNCRDRHRSETVLCAECAELLTYARQRLERCPFAEDKPTCANCPVHCYKPEMRARVRTVMRFAGPRMILHHPLVAIRHLLDGRRKTPLDR